MTYARQSQVCLQDTRFFHVVARCVRRSWLWGFDQYAGKDYSHRKEWILERLRFLTAIFAIDVCAYAVMSNHYHLALHIDVDQAAGWSDEEVIERWGRLFRLPTLIERFRNGQSTDGELETVHEILARWRSRLHDLSWFMRALNEHLARRANAEDGCTGRFWEGRFKSQALLDEAALLTVMAYVDSLNPVRAGIAATPEASDFTSIQQRIRERSRASADETEASVPLLPFQDQGQEKENQTTIPFRFDDYLQLVDWTGRSIRNGKGSIDSSLPPILARLKIDPQAWEHAMMPGRKHLFGRALGQLDHLRLHAQQLKQTWIRGQGLCAKLYS